MMSSINNASFGGYTRQLREDRNLPFRIMAAEFDIDAATPSKIEKNERNTNEQTIEKLSEIFTIDKVDLKVCYLSDKITYQLLNEEDGVEILKVAEQKIKYHKQQQAQ